MTPNDADARLLAALPPLGQVATVRRVLHDAQLSTTAGLEVVRRLVAEGRILIEPPNGLTDKHLIARLA